jgi:hypothetical protein
MSKTLKLGGLLAVLGAAVFLSGCFPPPGVTVRATAPTVVASAGYSPQYYNGYVVYYDDYGRPLYYMNGAPVYIPSSYPQYGVYVNHYNMYRPHYHQWYQSHGVQYRTYRQPGYAPAPAPTVVVRPGRVYRPAPPPVYRPAPAPTVVVRPPPVYRPAPPPRPTVIVH